MYYLFKLNASECHNKTNDNALSVNAILYHPNIIILELAEDNEMNYI